MREKRCRHCQKRPLWRYHNNDLGACKRCYHEVWQQTRERIRELHKALGFLERGNIPEPLKAYGESQERIAESLLRELEAERWQTGAKHEVPILLQRLRRLVGERP